MKDAATAEPRAAEYASIAAANPPRSGRSAIMAFSAPYRLIPSILRASTEIRAISVPIAADEANETSAAVPAAIAMTAGSGMFPAVDWNRGRIDITAIAAAPTPPTLGGFAR